MDPPSTGPRERPVYAMAAVNPSTLPLSWGGNTDVRMATLVPNIMELPTPWITLNAIRASTVRARPQSSEEREKTDIPMRKILLRPTMSASRPKGTRKAAEARM